MMLSTVMVVSLHAGKTVVAVHDLGSGGPTIRTTNCAFFLSQPGRCSACVDHRKTLHAMLCRSQQTACSPTNPASSVNLRYLTTPQKIQRFRRLRLSFKHSQSQVERLKAKLAECLEKRSTEVDSDLHEDLLTIMEENTPNVLKFHVM